MLRLITRNLLAVALLLAGLSEAAILHWALRVSGGSGLGVISFAALTVGLLLANMAILRALRRARRPALRTAFLCVSLGALLSGPGLGVAFTAGLADERLAFSGGAAAIALGFGSILWGATVGQRKVAVEEVPVRLRALPMGLDGFEIAHITDLHIGAQLRAQRLREFVDRVNDVGADLIAITGDIFDFDPAFIEEGCRELARLQAPHGVWAVLGNHDVYTGVERVAEGLARWTGIHVLRNEWVSLEVNGERLILLGVEDSGESLANHDPDPAPLRRVAAEAPALPARVLLIHRPSYFEHITALGLPLALAGHTHGGQVALPRPWAHHNVSRLLTEYTRGLFASGDSLLYVNRGLGVAGPPIRLNCPREIARIRLHRA